MIDINTILHKLLTRQNKEIIKKARNSGKWHYIANLNAEFNYLPSSLAIIMYEKINDGDYYSELYELSIDKRRFSLNRYTANDNSEIIYHPMNCTVNITNVPYDTVPTEEELFQLSLLNDFGTINMETFSLMKEFKSFVV